MAEKNSKAKNLTKLEKPTATEYLTLKETALMTAVPYAKVKRDVEGNVLPAYHIGRKYFVRREDAQKYKEFKEEQRNIKGYTIREIMAIIPLSYAFLMGQVRSGELHAIKIGRQYIIPEESFTKYIEDNKAEKIKQ